MLKDKKLLMLTSFITLLPMLAGLLLWNRLPESVPIHWNAAGEVDGYGSRALAVFGLPCFVLVMHWLCVIVSSLDPKNKEQSTKAVKLVLWIAPVLSLVLEAMVYAVALGYELSVNSLLPVMFGVLFVVIGNWLPKCRPNHTIGIRLPWTLDSEETWNATHRMAGWLWVAGGLLILAMGFLLPGYSFFILLAVVLILALIPGVYSYCFYKRCSAQDSAEDPDQP